VDFDTPTVLSSKSWPARFWPPPRRDAVALSFGLAFVLFGGAGLARAAGAPLESLWLSPLILIGLGMAGLLSQLRQRRRS
jgi:hypothetical protein